MKAPRVLRYGKIAAGFAGVFLLLAALYSAYYIAAESGHDCVGCRCPVCSVIQLCENFLRQADSGSIRRFFEIVRLAAVIFAVFFLSLVLSIRTPVAQKIRLNN